MSKFIELVAQERTQLGKGHTRRLRRLEGQVPAIIYGEGKEPLSIQLPFNIVKRRLEDEIFYSSVLTIVVGKKKESVILKELQRHPSRNDVIHMDFLRISTKHALTIDVPLHFSGEDEAPGIKDGGMPTYHQHSVNISCLPANIPENIPVDISQMNLGDILTLEDLALPEGVTLTAEHLTGPVVGVAMAKVVVEEETPVEGEEGEQETTSEESKADDADEKKSE